ncbi:MAG TPA: TlpA family protein disulfide reductase [Candidatus Pseudomonas excrementavium]|uniref:TlpA family protein disulfide reductase n=1 Tax=Halopseudomonas bauzanensis TaxID=653930 RepID=UPI001C3A9BB6|nr:TlpA disulfide reductase family protein [Halopseudomonas bauzanensis]HIZ50449.1 TlpA family protein disulfide reductase [Candidatus Pseudomonas excrementavium]
MKKGLYGVMLGTAVLLAGCGGNWQDHRGNSVSQADLQDRWMVVNYWAEWCAPCRHELPEFNSLAKNPDIVVFGINYDGISGDELQALADEMDIEFAVMGQDFVDSFGLERPQVLPTTYVFNREGELLHSLAGPQTEETLLALLE